MYFAYKLNKQGENIQLWLIPFPFGTCVLFHASLVGQMVKCLPAVWETRVRFLGLEDPLEKEMATQSSTIAWKNPWTEEPGRTQSMGSQRVGHDWADSLSFPVVPYLFLTVASWSAYRFLRRQVRWSHIRISWRIFQFVVIHTVKGFGIVNNAEVDVFLELSCFFNDPADVANLILIPLPFLKPAWTSGTPQFTYYWSLAWRILRFTFLVFEMSAIVW